MTACSLFPMLPFYYTLNTMLIGVLLSMLGYTTILWQPVHYLFNLSFYYAYFLLLFLCYRLQQNSAQVNLPSVTMSSCEQAPWLAGRILRSPQDGSLVEVIIVGSAGIGCDRLQSWRTRCFRDLRSNQGRLRERNGPYLANKQQTGCDHARGWTRCYACMHSPGGLVSWTLDDLGQ